uniref:Uridine 5'-monophosphate synthase n=1 Tax=Trichuris muris TaxID=70415 RepID=A0A5S6Q669_TRIMR
MDRPIGKEALLDQLFDTGVFHFGEFTLKCGSLSPIYVDLRRLISFPTVLKYVERELWALIKATDLHFNRICGVPYGAIPICAVLCVEEDLPMLFLRKEAKGYGMKKLVDGLYEVGDRCLIVEDVITHGASVCESVQALRSRGLLVSDAVIILDRCQGGEGRLSSFGVRQTSLFNLKEVVNYFYSNGRISREDFDRVNTYLTREIEEECPPLSKGKSASSDVNVPNDRIFIDRNASLAHPTARRLWQIIESKKSNLCVACDYLAKDQILQTLELIGDVICVAKLHADIIKDFDTAFATELKRLSRHKNFLLLEDRKFADTGDIVKKQLLHSAYKLTSWADMVTVHPVAGHGLLQAIRDISATSTLACLVVVEMSTDGNLSCRNYKDNAVSMARAFSDVVAGFVSQKRPIDDPTFLYFTPGVHFQQGCDHVGQRWRSIEVAIKDDGNDVAIVGRGVTTNPDVLTATRKFKEMAWEALLSRNGETVQAEE